jgi:S-DNA-T family DNA segregation ATPase FtsK/SpoIIIE
MTARQKAQKKSNTQRKKTSVKKQSKTQSKMPERTMVQEEIILVISMAVSVILFLSNFNLSGKVGIYISGFTFGIIGVLAYILPFFVFFVTAFCLSNRGNHQASRKILGAIIFFAALAALVQLVTTSYIAKMKLSDYYTSSSQYHKGGGIIGGMLVMLFCSMFDTVVTFIIIISIMLISVVLISGKAILTCIAKKSRKSFIDRKEYQKQRMERQQVLEEEYMKNNNGRRPPKTFVFSDENNPGDKKKHKKEQDNNNEALYLSSIKDKRKKREKTSKVNKASEVVNLDHLFQQNEDNDVKNSADKEAYIDNIIVPASYEEELKTKFGETQPATIVEQPTFNAEKDDTPVVNQNNTGTKAVNNSAKAVNTAGDDSTDADKLNANLNNQHMTYVFPPLNVLSVPKTKINKKTVENNLKETAMKLQSTLDSFGVHVTITNVSCGPAVTRYELQPEQGVKVSRITSLTDDIKLNLAAADIRIEAPIPGKAAVGIEVPNKSNSMVALREMLESKEFKQHSFDIAFAVGKDIGGQTIVTDIAKMPHLLIAGATGSGKSVCINTLIMSILYKANPSDVRLIMIDPKVVELSVYNGIPHLLIPVVTDSKKASAALNWAVAEMTERYNKFAESGVRDLKGYNDKVTDIDHLNDENYQKMPQIVIIIDELADLMMVAPGEVEDAICRLAQMARAAGLHLIIATQRPSVNVITGLIKANIPSRIAFAVSSAIDSRTILDSSGAEKLLGKGDMLFFPSGYSKPVRIQGAFISDKEVSAVVDFLKSNNDETQYNEKIKDQIANAKAADSPSGRSNDRDDYFMEAGKFIIEKDKASIGMLQRIYKIGFNRAARIMDQLSGAGVVGPEEGTKPRKVLMTLEQFEQYIEEK